jgi:penicillin-binding protein-related factor A (putative recombinase)
MNPGKKFQNDFVKSLSPQLTCVRLNDSREGLKHERCVSDYLVYNGQTLHAVELKTHKGRSIQIGENQAIKIHQIEGLIGFEKKPNCEGIFILNFREHKETYRIMASNLSYLYKHEKKKSITINDCKEHGFLVPEEDCKYDLSFLNPVVDFKEW